MDCDEKDTTRRTENLLWYTRKGHKMTDKELLELAAKAAGIEIQWPSIGDASCRRTDTWDIWNPLTDDGDALRLAVKLKLNISIGKVSAWSGVDGCEPVQSIFEGDPYAATRRAITRAAAAIGEAMKS
jgi:hypothetical protein